MYGSTNKRNAEHQIAKRYRRLQRARLALDRKQLRSHTKQKATNQEDKQLNGDSELRYHVSPSKNYALDIFGTLRNNRGDPAYHVCFPDNNAIVTHGLADAFKEIFTEASRSFTWTTNRP
jgi:hypothetical protein